MRTFAILATIMIIGSACQVSVHVGSGPPPIHGDPEFGDVVLATEIDSVSKAPITEVTEFASDVAAMYATIHVKNAKAGEFRFTWKKDGDDAGTIVMTVPDIYDNWVSTWIKPTGEVPAGDGYSLGVEYNGRVVSTTAFRVVEARRARQREP